MTDLTARKPSLPAMTPDAIDRVRQFEGRLRQEPQLELKTTHALHAGMYARTVHMPKHMIGNGVFIRVPTLVIVSGHVTVFIGDHSMNLCGYHVIEAEAGRKQVFVSHEETDITMLFLTKAKTVEEAENEFTNEPDMLLSRGRPEDILIGGAR
jgi:hypothetical protein